MNNLLSMRTKLKGQRDDLFEKMKEIKSQGKKGDQTDLLTTSTLHDGARSVIEMFQKVIDAQEKQEKFQSDLKELTTVLLETNKDKEGVNNDLLEQMAKAMTNAPEFDENELFYEGLKLMQQKKQKPKVLS